MKKIFGIATTLLLTAALAACGTGSNSGSSDSSAAEGESTKLVIGASVTPHAEILEQAKPLLAEEGIDLEIKTFDDYVLPNKALENGDIDANYFQHIPYTNKSQTMAMTLSMPVRSISSQWVFTQNESLIFQN